MHAAVLSRKHLGHWQSGEERSITRNRSVTARPVAGIFFPLRRNLRLDPHGCSPAILGKICREAARSTSFDTAAESLADLAEVDFCGHQVGRIAREVGDQLREARDRQVDDFQNRRLRPETEVVPKLGVVSIDGGRYQTRSEGEGRGIHDPA